MRTLNVRKATILAALLMIGGSLQACSNPASNVTPAEMVESPAAPAEEAAAEAPADEAAAEAPAEEATAVESLTISNEHSRIEWVGSKVTGSHDGGFETFTGTLEFNPADPTGSSINITIQMASITSDNERLTGHLRTDDFFDVENHPEASFRTTEIRSNDAEDATHTIVGDLTLRGETNRISFPANIEVSDEAVKASAEFAINRRNWGINYDGMQNDLIRNEVVIKLDINAPRG